MRTEAVNVSPRGALYCPLMLRARRLAPSLALAAASAALTVLAFEAAFRLLHVPVGTVQINRATVRRSANPRLLFELRSGAVARAEVDYRINAAGLRGPEVSEEKPAGVRRIAVLGDSVAFGFWVAEKDAFPRQLESMLNEAEGGPVEVLNLAVPGYNLDQEIETLRSKALALAPDLVVVAFCLNDLEGVFSYELGLVQDRTERRRNLVGRAWDALLPHSVLLSWIEYRLAEAEARRAFVRARDPLGGPLYEPAVSEQRKALVARFTELRALLAPRGIPGLVAVFPVFAGRFERYRYRDLHRAVVEAATESGLRAVDLLDCFSAYDFRPVRVDVVHPSPMGHRIAAHAVRDALCDKDLSCGTPGGRSCSSYRSEEFPRVHGY